VVAVTDRILVAGLLSGDPRGLRDVYQRYADRLYGYCLDLLGDPAPAADAVHNTFVVASQRADRLREPERLRVWLYALARNECLRVLRRRPRRGTPARPAPAEPGGAGQVAGLPRPDREVFVLAARHELPLPEIGELLGLSSMEVASRLERARTRLDRTLSAVPAGYPAVPDLLWPRLELNCFDPGFGPERATIVQRAGRFARDTGFPRPLSAPLRARMVVAGAAAIAVGLLAAGTGAIAATGADREPQAPPAAAPGTSVAPTGLATPPAVTPAARPAGGRAAPPSLALSPSPTTGVPPPATGPPGGTSPAALTVQAGADVDCRFGGRFGYTLEVTASADRGLDTAELVVAVGPQQHSFPMEVDGSRATAETDPMYDPEFEWWVEASSGDGQTAESAPERVTQPCD